MTGNKHETTTKNANEMMTVCITKQHQMTTTRQSMTGRQMTVKEPEGKQQSKQSMTRNEHKTTETTTKHANSS